MRSGREGKGCDSRMLGEGGVRGVVEFKSHVTSGGLLALAQARSYSFQRLDRNTIPPRRIAAIWGAVDTERVNMFMRCATLEGPQLVIAPEADPIKLTWNYDTEAPVDALLFLQRFFWLSQPQ
eukprot:Gregarina_sp_Pseudo_9__2041@NODE_2414_length_1003_cov_11_995851_g2221_i0_p3_GENE_NODE_2414_length_1003_cov_11_995851_g2221_i0NODE_2414_length_1003_cov_11_995851_g2221_i0_p3_ORF_typecomplete_len123_score1_81_NODE_2414_length_1003_cov_11_995851_g2221_i0595963